jgi:15-cis-phytoene desaturase
MNKVLIIGAGLAGLSAGMDLVQQGFGVTLLERYKVLGGRTADWDDDGMHVESGLHRWLGFYQALPALFEKANLDPEAAVIWQDELEIRLPDGGPQAVLGLAPLYNPVETLTGFLGNNDLLSPVDKAAAAYLFTTGLAKYAIDQDELDQETVLEFAKQHGVPQQAITNLLVPLTEGIFFLPPERYSALVLIGLFVPGIKRPHTIRVGSFAGGMSDVMANPIAEAIQAQGGQIHTEAEVERLAVRDGSVIGVYVNGELIEADHVVLATSLAPAQRLLRQAFGDHPWFNPLQNLPTMPAVTLQIELEEPALAEDHVIFSPTTLLASYAEQSRTTFDELPGRLSIDLAKPEDFIDKQPQEILDAVLPDTNRLGMNIEDKIKQYRVVSHADDFYLVGPGNEALRPPQATPIPGLTLAGDYTQQRLFCTMEGAVISGYQAAQAVTEAFS